MLFYTILCKIAHFDHESTTMYDEEGQLLPNQI